MIRPLDRTRVLEGLGVSDGIAVGKGVCISTRITDILQIPIPEADVETEVQNFLAAVEKSRVELRALRGRVGRELGEDLAGIFDAQALVLTDGAFLDKVEKRIRREHVNAEWALHEAAQEIQARFLALDSEHLRERADDLRDVCRHVVRNLRGLHLHQLSELAADVVIVADDLTPSDAVRLGRENVVGFVIEHGSRTSHTTIIARSLGIPAVTGVQGILGLLVDHAEVPVVVDGDRGRVTLQPDVATLEDVTLRLADLRAKEEAALQTRELESVTIDGASVRVMANIELPEEIEQARRYGAAGIGLYRSEFLYIEKSPELPTEDDHVEIYRRLIEAADPHPAIIRTYDLGGRKIAREVMETHEDNPVLGLRGIRLTLARLDIFRTQIRALLRATVYGDVWVMLPMVALIEEVRRFREVMEEVMEELEREGVPFRRDFNLGSMIEVPAAALMADLLAREVDFFSIGSNDLIQYALAVDRNNEHVAHLYRPLHPAMLRMLVGIVEAARDAGIELSLCGEMAADPEMTPVLVGCGLRRLSVSPRQVPTIKQRIRGLHAESLRELVRQCMDLPTADEVQARFAEALGESVSAD